MKKVALLILALATAALFAEPAFAGLEHQAMHEEAAEPAGMSGQESMMQESMEKMRAQMEKINKTKKPKERLKLLQEHNKSMRDSINAMLEMMGEKRAGDHCDQKMGRHMMGEKKVAGHCDHKMGGNKACDHCDHKMGGNKACDLCDHKMGGKMTGDHCDHKTGSQQTGKADGDAAPAAQSNLDQLSATDKTSAGSEKKIWVCPMHPEVAQDHPGYCPKCGMDLIEVEQPAAAQPEPGRMTGMMGKRRDMALMLMLMLMEQMIEHNEAMMDLLK